jgi:hypothetical protein
MVFVAMLKRLDDVSNEVRVTACYTIAKVFTNLPDGYDVDFFRGNVAHAYSTLLIHLDDSEEGIQDVEFRTRLFISP